MAAIEMYEVAYGPTHRQQLEHLLGDDRRLVATVIYEQPTRHAYALADGRYAVLTTTKYGYSTRVALFPDHATWAMAWDRTLGAVPDPETGRRR